MDTIEQMAADVPAPHPPVARRARGRVLVRGSAVHRALGPLRALGYRVDEVDDGAIAVTGWVPSPGTATVQEIDARIAALEALRSEALAADRLTSA